MHRWCMNQLFYNIFNLMENVFSRGICLLMSWACTIGIWSTLAQLNLNLVSARLSSRHAISKLDDSPQNRNISCNTKRFNVQLERLMFCKDVCKLYHSTLHWAIWRNATPFVCTLYNSKLRWANWRNATPLIPQQCTRYIYLLLP